VRSLIYRTLSLRFAKMLATAFAVIAAVAFTVDFFDFARQTAGQPGYSVTLNFWRSMLKLPALMEQIMPFVVQFAAVGLLSMAARRHELVAFRGAGISAFQFIAPLCAVAGLLGICTMFALDPLAVKAKSSSKGIEAAVNGVQPDASFEQSPLWIARPQDEELVVIGAKGQRNGGLELLDVTYLRFSGSRKVLERIDANSAVLTDDHLVFRDAVRVDDEHNLKEEKSRFEMVSPFGADALRTQFGDARDIPFPELRHAIAAAGETGNNENPIRTRFYSLLLLPLFLMAMVLLSAPISIRFERTGQSAAMMGTTVLMGFVLYAAGTIFSSLGSAGVIAPSLSTTIPVFVLLGVGLFWLLVAEDG
jgi:lipopolysaccharide export system permease protein